MSRWSSAALVIFDMAALGLLTGIAAHAVVIGDTSRWLLVVIVASKLSAWRWLLARLAPRRRARYGAPHHRQGGESCAS